MILDLDPDNLHHAYIVAGEPTAALECVRDFVREEVGMEPSGHPDVTIIREDRFGIDSARRIRGAQERKAFDGGKKIFILAFDSITTEAQNSLLKSFEEPTAGTHFFAITPSVRILLPTLISRVEVIELRADKTAVGEDAGVEVEAFLEATIPERIEMVADIVNKKSSGRARQLLNTLEQAIYEQKPGGYESALREIMRAKKYVGQNGASIKTLLHHVALSVPTKKE